MRVPSARQRVGARQLRKQHPRIEEAEGLAGQVRVRREVVREVALHVGGVAQIDAQDRDRTAPATARRDPRNSMSAQHHEMSRNATSRLLAQLMPIPGGIGVEPARDARRRRRRSARRRSGDRPGRAGPATGGDSAPRRPCCRPTASASSGSMPAPVIAAGARRPETGSRCQSIGSPNESRGSRAGRSARPHASSAMLHGLVARRRYPVDQEAAVRSLTAPSKKWRAPPRRHGAAPRGREARCVGAERPAARATITSALEPLARLPDVPDDQLVGAACAPDAGSSPAPSRVGGGPLVAHRSHVYASTSARAWRAIRKARTGYSSTTVSALAMAGGIVRRHEQPGFAVADASPRCRRSRSTRPAGPPRRPRAPTAADCRRPTRSRRRRRPRSSSGISIGSTRPDEAIPFSPSGRLAAAAGRLAAVSGDGQGGRRESVPHHRERFERDVDPVVGLEIASRQETRARRHPVAVPEAASCPPRSGRHAPGSRGARTPRAGTPTAPRSRARAPARDGRGHPSARDGPRPRRCGS